MIQLLSNTLITENLPITFTSGTFGPAFFVAGRSDVTGSHIVKAANYNSTGNTTLDFSFDGVGAGASGKLTWITAPMNVSNTIGHQYVETHTATVGSTGNGSFSLVLPEYSVAVFEIGASNAGYGHGYVCQTHVTSEYPRQ